jgi:isocitrate lyase
VCKQNANNEAANQFMDAVKYKGISLTGMREIAGRLGVAPPYFNWEACRVPEGYYRVRGGVEYCIVRSRAYSRYADLLWMETARPGLAQAREFANGVKEIAPHILLAYNLSPSFSWASAGMSREELKEFTIELGKLGFVWQFITLAGSNKIYFCYLLMLCIIDRVPFGCFGNVKFLSAICSSWNASLR